ncbi:MAG TPA: site-2 protease family protein, partial [Roseiflexaceae bacterium]|nr:site-2 protease family protein [Roseiflexaceae bacterium]
MVNTSSFEQTDRLELTARVREALQGLMDIDRYAWDERGALTLHGRLSGPAAARYRAIRARMEALGFTPFLRRAGEQDELLAMPGVVERRQARIGLPLVLFLATIVTVLMAGAAYEGVDVLTQPGRLLAGVPFAATLLGILFAHEMGH